MQSPFIDNKYRRWYFQICDRARGRFAGSDMERHHVLPKSLGGTNAAANLVFLTYREHFLAHWLLTKLTTGNLQRKMNYALSMMARNPGFRIITSWQYERAKIACIAALRGRKISDKTRSRMSATARNRSEEYRAKQSAAHLGKKPSAETRAKLSAAMKKLSPEKRAQMVAARRWTGHSAETIERIRQANTGKKRSHETRAKLSAASMGNKSSRGLKFGEERRANMSAGITAAWARPEVRQRQAAAIRAASQSPEVRARKIAAAKASWAERKAAMS